jgi:hypothetical protein
MRLKALTLALCALIFAGCATTQTPQTPEQRAQQLAGIANVAAWVGTVEHLKQHPKDRPYFVAAEVALARLVNSANATPADLAAALQALPVKELRGPYGVIIIAAVVTISEGAFSREPIEQNAYLRKIIEAIRDGIKSGCAQDSPAGARGAYGPRFLFVAGPDIFEATNIYSWTRPDDPRRALAP